MSRSKGTGWCFSWEQPGLDPSGLHVPLHMESQVIRAREGALTQVTLERSVSSVLPEVTRELVRPGELPAAALPVTVVRLFTWETRVTCVRFQYQPDINNNNTEEVRL